METPTTTSPLSEMLPSEMAMPVEELKNQVALIQDVMKEVMKDGEHYGSIPGAGDKKTLFKSGAEKLSFVFRLKPRFHIDTNYINDDDREYSVRCELTFNGQFAGEGVGSCSTRESKYRYRSESTGKEVPQQYWQQGKNPELIGGAHYSVKKSSGKWFICHRVEYDDPADYYNTCLKMAKKRAHIDAILTATAASDIFAQDDVKDFNEGKTAKDRRGSPEPKFKGKTSSETKEAPQTKDEGGPPQDSQGYTELNWTDEEIRGYLKELDEVEYKLTDFDTKFLGQNLTRGKFSPGQRKVILDMVNKYGTSPKEHTPKND